MSTRACLTLLMTSAITLSSAASALAQSDAGWWVVLGSVSAPGNSVTSQAQAEVRRIEAASRRCGLAPFQDFSSKFRFFTPGYMVVVAGAYANRAAADAAASKSVRCIDGAYVKHSAYAGE
jgi:hypothetical protein